MAYVKTSWKSGDTVTATKLNKIEQGIYDTDAAVAEVAEDVSDIQAAMVEVDDTLSTTGKAADAKATGDAITAQSEAIQAVNDFLDTGMRKVVVGFGDGKIVQGGINTNTGSNTNSTTKVRAGSAMRDNNLLRIECDEGYCFIPMCYTADAGTYMGIYQPDGTYVKSSTGTGFDWWTDWNVDTIGNNRYTIMMAQSGDGMTQSFTPSQALGHFRFHRRSGIGIDEAIEYASENEKLLDPMLLYEEGGITASGSNYDGDASYKAGTKRSDYFAPDCEDGDLLYFTNLYPNVLTRVFVFTSGNAIIEDAGYESNIGISHKQGNKYRIVFQKHDPNDGSLLTLSTSEAINGLRIYIKENQESPIIHSPNKELFCVTSYNVGQWYNGSGAIAAVQIVSDYNEIQNKILKRLRPDILCCQEYTPKINILGEYYDQFYAYNSPNNNIYTGKIIAGNYEQTGNTGVQYENQASGDLNCNYAYNYIWLNGRKICVVTTHLSTTAATAKLQMAELMAFAETQDYIIICGDFNLDCSDVTDSNYVDAFKPWVDANYNMANYSDWGFMITSYNTLSEAVAIDNIITSENIEIKYAFVDYQKRDAALDNKIDHMPISAYFSIN